MARGGGQSAPSSAQSPFQGSAALVPEIDWRSLISTEVATRHPSFTGPSRNESSTLTSSKKTSENSASPVN